ncbi:glycoside hydrolase family 3 C-terminal domain-containing protein [Furfurilactobacillus milii]|uniref:Glycosyl hydrolase n=1 Tax=Furfurilactobacillus rossiae TaxID=231049 RepID=A0A7C9IWB3_9LACO|nr:glycoside hydrolase family 3 C-terminal domain-containing protein [Furfurilactobacillus milii]MYV04335.1 glycosyl hydrolase [Furfurilactobacillus milii]
MKQFKVDEAFVDQLTLAEKAAFVSGKDFWYTAGVQRLNVGRMMMTDGPSGLRKQEEGTDATGVNKSVTAVNFPGSALAASTFDREMMHDTGKALGTAASHEQISLLLGPGMNIKRSPLAGRNFEYFSEDPYLTGEIAAAYVRGVQEMGVGVSIKHFAANNRESQRFTNSSNMSERVLREIYLAAFEKVVVEAHPASVMVSYNAINGTLNSQNQWLLTDVLRHEWGFDGLILSDWGAVVDQVAALRAGLDLEMPGHSPESEDAVINGVKSGELTMATLNRAVLYVLKTVEKWGSTQEVSPYPMDEQHIKAREAADDGLILLKNESDMLPIKPQDRLAIIGAFANQPRYQGSGSSHVNAYQVVTPLDVARALPNDITYAPGYAIEGDGADQSMIDEAVANAQDADKVVFFAGFPESMESEGFDKTTMSLPEAQVKLLNQILSVNPHVVVVLQNGSVVEMPWADQVPAILETYLAGEAVGEATWDILSGAVNPSGKLAETFPLKLADNPTYGTFARSYSEENYHEGLFVGYRYYDVKQQPIRFAFGHGLSYTTFKYSGLKIVDQGDSVAVTFKLTNTGKRSGREAVQVYVANHASTVEMPVKTLAGFEKPMLAAGESQLVSITLPRRAFSWYDESKPGWRVDNGSYDILVGSASDDIRMQKTVRLNWAAAQDRVTLDSYINDVMDDSSLAPAATKSGLDAVFEKLRAAGPGAAFLMNMPIRHVLTLGATGDQLSQFLKLANRSTHSKRE